MRLTNYEGTDFLPVSVFLEQNPDADRETVQELLKTCNVSFVLEGINRWQSTMSSERKDS